VRFLSVLSLVIVLSAQFAGVLHAQDQQQLTDASFRTAHQRMLEEAPESRPNDALVPGAEGERKSGSLAVLYSVILPGMGELYAGRFDRGMYPLVTEGALWLGLIGVNTYGTWVQDDARLFARQHAAFDPVGKSDEYYVHIENYKDIYDFNNQRLIERRLDEMYPDEAAWQWDWDSDENRAYYKDRRILSDKMHNAVSFFVLGMVANRIWSAIQSAMFVRRHNAALEQQSSLLPTLHTQLIARAGRTDEIRFTFSW